MEKCLSYVIDCTCRLCLSVQTMLDLRIRFLFLGFSKCALREIELKKIKKHHQCPAKRFS